jgi:hypothetical protein
VTSLSGLADALNAKDIRDLSRRGLGTIERAQPVSQDRCLARRSRGHKVRTGTHAGRVLRFLGGDVGAGKARLGRKHMARTEGPRPEDWRDVTRLLMAAVGMLLLVCVAFSV